jgi:flagellar biosynthesis/type III secretory pathway chaperone
MKLLLDKLIDLLDEEILAYGSLLEVLKKEKASIIRCDYNHLKKIACEKESDIMLAGGMEKKIREILGEIAVGYGLSAQHSTLGSLVGLTEGAYRRRIGASKINLESLVGKVRKQNEANKKLLENSLGLVKDAFSLLSNVAAAGTVYCRTGRMDDKSLSGSLLRGAI